MAAFWENMARAKRVANHHGWPRLTVDRRVWGETARALGEGRLTLLGLWAEQAFAHMALLDETDMQAAVITLACRDGSFPSVGRHHPPAIRLERAIKDLFGLEPEDAPDARHWLDHGRWGVRQPLGKSPQKARGRGVAYPFLPVEGESLHQIPVGPVHAGIIEPGHFRFTANGETVARLEERLGYVHKGIEGLMAGATLEEAVRLADRTSGDSTVAYAYAFSCAAELALGAKVPERARWLRALMAEMERLANHLGDIGAICNDASFSLMHAHCGVLRERVLRAADIAFGHRLMRDRIVPGGVTDDLTSNGTNAVRALLDEVRARFAELIELYDRTASLQDRTVSTGILRPDLAQQFGAGGYVGRASGRDFDARRDFPYAPYDELTFDVPLLGDGDVDARVWVRIREVEQSLSLIGQILNRLPKGLVMGRLPKHREMREGVAMVEAFRGDILVWLRVGADGRIERCHLRDASWFQWPLLEAVIEGNIIADFPLCNKSFNCSYSGHDL